MKRKLTLIILLANLFSLPSELLKDAVASDAGISVEGTSIIQSPAETDARIPLDTKISIPSALNLKYGITLLEGITPYVGTGLAYILPTETNPGEPPNKTKKGVAGQAGIKIDLTPNSSFKMDYQYMYIAPDSASGTPLKPHSLGLGLQIKF